MLTIQLFGSPEVSIDGQAVKISRRKSRALLYYLAGQPNPVSREGLLGIFWADSPRPAALQTLRTTLHGLRQALGAVLIVDAETVALASDSQVDARQIEVALSKPLGEIEELQTALDLYRGEFLADFSLPDGQEFEDWVTVERERYRRLVIRGLAALSTVYEASGDLSAALNCLDRALALNPLQEDLQREAIRLEYLAGDRPGAIRRYDQLRRLLDEELGVPPMPETRKLYDAILNETLAKNEGRTIDKRQPAQDRSGRLSLKRERSSPSQPFAAGEGRANVVRYNGVVGYNGVVPRPSSSVHELPFVGRKADLQMLGSLALDQRLILIEGEPGIGKTRLVEEFLRGSEAIVLAGQGRELEQHLPYQPLIEALRGLVKRPDWPALQSRLRRSLPAVWLEETSRLLPELEGTKTGQPSPGRAAEEARLWEGLAQFLGALARQGPVLLFLDDLHWADASTLALLGYLVRHSQEQPLRFMATAQPAPARSPLAALKQALIREDRLARLALARLSPEEVEEVARQLSPAGQSLLAEWLLRYSEGNPYILVELVREARARRFLLPDGTLNLEPGSASPVVPQNIYSLVQARLEKLSAPARRVLDVAVAAGREFEFEIIVQAAGLSEMASLDALDELSEARLIHPIQGSRFAFDHSLIMEVAYRETGELRHQLLHRQVAEALESLYSGRIETAAGLIAWHFAEGNDLRHASPFAFLAGQQAARLAAWTEAVGFFEQALQGAGDHDRLPIWMELGNSQMKSGHFASASETFRDALRWSTAQPEKERLDEIRLALANSLLTQARFAEVIHLAKQVLSSDNPGTAQAAELLWGTALSLEGSDLDGAVEHLRAAEGLFAGEGGGAADMASLAQILFELGSVLAQQGNLLQAIAFYRQSLSVASQTTGDETLERRILAYNNLAYHLHLLADASAREYALSGLELAQEKGVVGLLPYLYSTMGEIALGQGELEEAEGYFIHGLEIAERLAMPERVAGLTANLGLVAARRDQTGLAIHRLSTALGLADSLGTRHLSAQIRLWLAPLLPPEEAHARLAEARAVAESSGRRRLLEEAKRVELLLKQ